MPEIRRFEFEEGDSVMCVSKSEENHERLKVGKCYTIHGMDMIDGNAVYGLRDETGEIHYSIDRFIKVKENVSDPISDSVPKDYDCVKAVDNVNHPQHYTNGKYEVIDVIEDATKDLKGIEAVCTGNALKYIMRWKFKNGVEDLKKAVWYLNRLIDTLEGRR